MNLICDICKEDLKCLAGASAHRSNWFCPKCDDNAVSPVNATDNMKGKARVPTDLVEGIERKQKLEAERLVVDSLETKLQEPNYFHVWVMCKKEDPYIFRYMCKECGDYCNMRIECPPPLAGCKGPEEKTEKEKEVWKRAWGLDKNQVPTLDSEEIVTKPIEVKSKEEGPVDELVLSIIYKAKMRAIDSLKNQFRRADMKEAEAVCIAYGSGLGAADTQKAAVTNDYLLFLEWNKERNEARDKIKKKCP